VEYRAPLESYSGKVREIVLGKGEKAIKIGGESSLPFHFFEGLLPNPPRLALEVHDMEPKDWAEWVLEPFKDVVADPVKWARKCVDVFGAESICLQLVSTDPMDKDTSPEEAAETTKKIAEAINVPLIVYGTGDEEKDIQVLTKVAEVCDGENLLLGPVLKENYEEIGKAALEHGHSISAQSPMDINLMKELNIKLCKFFPPERIVIDPLSSALGYGMEYSFTLMERAKQTGVVFKDGMTQMPIIANLAGECWKTKEAKENKEQGLLWEGMTALSLLLAGANILILRHPETLKLVKEMLLREGK
jgi:acetyl-CoA decarbonylase/synthase complex subunit delta